MCSSLDMKKLLDKNTDEELIDEIEKMKVERLRTKSIVIDLLNILYN